MTEPAEPRGKRIPKTVTVVATLHVGRSIAYAAVTVAFVISALIAHQAASKAGVAAATAQKTSSALKHEVARVLVFREEQLTGLHATDVRACRSRHRLVQTVSGLLRRSIALERKPIPNVSDALRRRSLSVLRSGLRNLKRSDCRRVTPLGPVNPKPGH